MFSRQRSLQVATTQGTVHSRKVLVCTNAYTPPAAGPLRRSVIPVCSVAVVSQPLAHQLRARALPNGEVVSDMYRLLSYYRFDAAGRLVMRGRGGYTEGAILKRMERLRGRVTELYGNRLGELRWEYSWGGNVAVTTNHFDPLCLAPDRGHARRRPRGSRFSAAVLYPSRASVQPCAARRDRLMAPAARPVESWRFN